MGLTDTIASIDEKMALLEIEKMNELTKAMAGGTPQDILRANDELAKYRAKTVDNQKSYTFDPFVTMNNMGYKDITSAVSYEHLRAMAKAPFIRAAIDTRQNQISNFSRPNVDSSSVGWTIKKKRSLFDDRKSKLTKQEQKEVEDVINFVYNCGSIDGDEFSVYSRISFESYLRQLVRDTLTIDQMASEQIDNRRGKISQFLPVDAATIRFADKASYYDSDGKQIKEMLKNGYHPEYVQLYNRRVVAEFYPWELMFGIRNLSTDVKHNGYGVSELEDLVRIVTWMLFGDSYNGKFFTQGASPKGILKVIGNVNQDRLNEFKSYWMQMVTGVQNAWRTPVIESDKVEWIDLQKSNQDMQFSLWQEYLMRVICAVFKIDPTEMGFHFSGMGGSENGYVSHQQRTDYSKDKGLVPLLRFFEENINKYIVNRYNSKYEFAFTGISPDDESSAVDINVKKVANWMTLNEVRELNNLPKVDGGDVVLNSIYYQFAMMSQQGGQEANDYVDDNDDGYGEDGMSDEDWGAIDDEMNKSAFLDINKWIEQGMPSTMRRIQ